MSSLLNTDITRATAVTQDVDKTIEDMFVYRDWVPEQIEKGSRVRDILAEAVRVIVANVPPCADRSAAIRKIREAHFSCTCSITSGGKF